MSFDHKFRRIQAENGPNNISTLFTWFHRRIFFAIVRFHQICYTKTIYTYINGWYLSPFRNTVGLWLFGHKMHLNNSIFNGNGDDGGSLFDLCTFIDRFSQFFINFYSTPNVIFQIHAHTGGPAVFVLSWAIIKAFAVEPKNLSVDGVSRFLLFSLFFSSFDPVWNSYSRTWTIINIMCLKLFITLQPFSLLLVWRRGEGVGCVERNLAHCYSKNRLRITWPNKSSLLLHAIFLYLVLYFSSAIRSSGYSML